MLCQIVGVETEKVSKEKAVADIEEEKVSLIEKEVTKKKDDCEADLAKAEPALIAAQAALDTLNKVRTCLVGVQIEMMLFLIFNSIFIKVVLKPFTYDSIQQHNLWKGGGSKSCNNKCTGHLGSLVKG